MDGYILGIPIILIVIVIAIAGYIYLTKLNSDYKNECANKHRRDGFKHIFYANSDFIAFNADNGLFRCGKLTAQAFFEKPISYISDYQWKWENSQNTRTDKFIFYISDVNYYLHEIYFRNDERKAEVEWARLQAVFNECISTQYTEAPTTDRTAEYDFFVSHASEDKDNFVRPLVSALTSLGLKVWYDEITMEIGDSLRDSIDRGLQNSKFAVVVLSKAFFAKQWPQYELDGLVNKAIVNGKKVILPIWHGVEHSDVSNFSHSLANKVALSSSIYEINDIANELLKIIQKDSD